MLAYSYETHDYDVVVVGAGGAGLRATLGNGRTRLEDGLCYKSVPN